MPPPPPGRVAPLGLALVAVGAGEPEATAAASLSSCEPASQPTRLGVVHSGAEASRCGPAAVTDGVADGAFVAGVVASPRRLGWSRRRREACPKR